jgi:chemotaxis signal transduction protein
MEGDISWFRVKDIEITEVAKMARITEVAEMAKMTEGVHNADGSKLNVHVCRHNGSASMLT